MERRPEREYSRTAWMAVAALIGVLAAVSFIPPQRVGGVTLRRANILSELISFDEEHDDEAQQAAPLFDEEEFQIDMEAVAERIQAEQPAADTARRTVQTHFEWIAATDTLAARRPALRDSLRAASLRLVDSLTHIELPEADSSFLMFKISSRSRFTSFQAFEPSSLLYSLEIAEIYLQRVAMRSIGS